MSVSRLATRSNRLLWPLPEFGIGIQPCCCDCFWCQGFLPLEMQVTITGLAEFSPSTCGSCASFNDTFICQLQTDFLAPFTFGGKSINTAKDCYWIYSLDPCVCDLCHVLVAYHRNLPDDWRLQVNLVRGNLNSGNSIVWIHFFNSHGDLVPHCYSDAQNVELPFHSYSGTAHSICDAAGSTATVTALNNA